MAKRIFTAYSVRQSPPSIEATAYLQDPSIAEANPRLGFVTFAFSGESCVGPGPTSSRLAVVDYNADLDVVFDPVRLKSNGKGFVVGAAAPLDNLKFHQVNVWAVINRTLELLEDERCFARRIPWAFDRGRLLVLPHAGYWENAFYDRKTGALHFFYFEDAAGKPVYTCLSYDIVNHELGHAVLDGLKPYYNEISTAATGGFHEYFGDAVALTAGLDRRELVVEVVGRGAGDLSGPNVLANLASEFGQALSPERYGSMTEAYLRSGNNKKKLSDLAGVYEPHDYSEVLTGLFWDMLREVYELLLSRPTGANKPDRSPQARVRALMSASTLVSRLMLRALDYCPPVDIDYADYARAIWQSDFVTYPLDNLGIRKTLIAALRGRGIIGSSDDLRSSYRLYNNQFREFDVERLGASETEAYRFVDANRALLQVPPTANLDVVRLYRTRKLAADGYRPPRELIVEFVWPELVTLKGTQCGGLSGSRATLWCGGTLVFDLDGNLLHYVLKGDTAQRRAAFIDYISYLIRNRAISVDDGELGLGARGHGANHVTATIRNGELRMSRTAALRHRSPGAL